jgi:predicted nucleotidyltransferase
MRRAETAGTNDSLPLAALTSLLREHPVRLAILFGSHATANVHSRSDIDIAIELESLRPGDRGYNEAFFGLSADLSETLETDEVDLVDLHMLSSTLAQDVFAHGVLLAGDPERAADLREQLTDESDVESPRERFDEALEKIDEHLR